MAERGEVPPVFRGAIEQAFVADEHRATARLVYGVTYYIVSRGMYRDSTKISRKKLASDYSHANRRKTNEWSGLDEAVSFVVHRFANEGLLESWKLRDGQLVKPFEKSTKFAFKQDDATRARVYELLGEYGESAGIKHEELDRFAQMASIYREAPNSSRNR